MSRYTTHAKAMADALTPEQVVAQLNTLATQLETLQKSTPMYKADEDQAPLDGEMPPMEGEQPPMEGEQPPMDPMAPEGEMPPMDPMAPEGDPALDADPDAAPAEGAEQEVEQAIEGGDEAELREVFGDMEGEELSQLVEFLVKLQEEKSAQVDKSSAGMDPLAMSECFTDMKKSQNALQAQVAALTKSITTLTAQVKKPAPRPASRPAMMNSESLSKSDRFPEMLKKSEVVEFLGTQIRRAGKPDADLLSLWQDASATGEDPSALRSLYSRAERIGVKIPHK